MKKIPRERLALVEKLWLKGRSESVITATVCKRYTISARQARRYVERVKAKIAARDALDPAAALARSERMLLETYQLARTRTAMVGRHPKTKQPILLEDPDTKTMAVVAFRLAELHGAGAAKRLEHSGPGGKPIPVQTQTGVVTLPEWGAPDGGTFPDPGPDR